MSRVGNEFKEKWNHLTSLSYKEQGIWFLNGFWLEVQNDAEKVWKWVNVAAGIDRRKEAGNDLDEFEAHRFLETLGETLTVQAMRNKFREIDIDFNKRMAFIEYLIFKYQKTVKLTVEAPQGDDSKLKKAQALADEAQVLLDETLRRLEEEKAALAAASRAEREAREAEDVAKKAESQARLTEAAAKQFEAEAVRKENAAVEAEAKAQAAEDAAHAAEDEQKSALAELHAQEQARDNALAGLQAKINDPSGTTVTKGRAKQEYEELKGKDPLPLQRAKINQEATVRKFERARKFASDERAKASLARRAAGEARENATDKRKHAEEDRAKAENDRAAAEVAREHAEEQRRAAEASTEAVAKAVAEAEAKFAEALAVLEEEKKKPISPFGKIWWLERELEEKKKYLPLHKGGVARK